MKSKKGITILTVCIVAAVAFSLVGASSIGTRADQPEESAEARKEIFVSTQTPVKGDIAVTGEYIGRVEPNRQVMVLPKVAGEVLAVHFSTGDYVEAGDILLEIDVSAYQTELAKAQAQLVNAERQAEQGLKTARDALDTYRANLENGANANLLQAEAQLAAAENGLQLANLGVSSARRDLREHQDKDEDTYINMSGFTYDEMKARLKDAVTQAQLTQEKAQQGVEQARTALEAVQTALSDGEQDIINRIEAAELQSDMTATYIALNDLRDKIGDAQVKAPISGLIEQRNVEPYGMATQSSPAFIISDKDSMTVSFKIPESSLAYIREGDAVTMEKNKETVQGTIVEVGTMVDAGGLFTVKASVKDAPFDLHTGSTIKIFADNQKAVGALLIPIDALYYENGQPFVYVVEGGVARRSFVETGIYNATHIQILSGLSADAEIIMTWNANLMDGAEITVQNDDAPATGEAGK